MSAGPASAGPASAGPASVDPGSVDPGSGGPVIRVAGADDAAVLVELVESAYRGESSRVGWTTEADLLGGQRTDLAMMHAALAHPDLRFLAAADATGIVVACCQLERLAGGACFGMFAVRPDLQGRGLGARMLAAAEDFVRAQWHAARMELLVISQRVELIAWYERRGYRRTARRESFPYGDERFGVPRRDDLFFVVLEKALAPEGDAAAAR